MIDISPYMDRLLLLKEYMSLRIDWNIPQEQTVFKQSDNCSVIMNWPIPFEKWLTYPYKTREEQSKHLWA